MCVVSGSHHHDGDVTCSTNGSAQLEPVDTRKHDVDEYNIGGVTLKDVNRHFAAFRLVDNPALIFEGKFDGLANAFVVFHAQNASSHICIVP
jgi:hypothetical protein